VKAFDTDPFAGEYCYAIRGVRLADTIDFQLEQPGIETLVKQNLVFVTDIRLKPLLHRQHRFRSSNQWRARLHHWFLRRALT